MFDEAEFASGATFADVRFAGDASFAAVVFTQGVPGPVERIRIRSNDGWQQWELALTRGERDPQLHQPLGVPMKRTARLLGMSLRSAENLKSNLFRKLRVHNPAQALVAARELGLLDE